jgi:endonuclease YncB( thermonuclease family)
MDSIRCTANPAHLDLDLNRDEINGITAAERGRSMELAGASCAAPCVQHYGRKSSSQLESTERGVRFWCEAWAAHGGVFIG